MRATWPGARSGRIWMTTLPLLVSRISVLSLSVISCSCLLEFPIVDESHGKGSAGRRVPKSIGERQRRATLDHLGHRRAVGQSIIIGRVRRFEGNSRLA